MLIRLISSQSSSVFEPEMAKRCLSLGLSLCLCSNYTRLLICHASPLTSDWGSTFSSPPKPPAKLHNRSPFTRQQWAERRTTRKEMFPQTSSSISPHHSPSSARCAGSAHILLWRRDPLSAALSLKQTHSAQIPQLCKTRLFAVSEPMPENTAFCTKPVHTSLQQSKHLCLNSSWF